MSTKNTICYGEHYHVYSECFEENEGVYLELNGTDLEFEILPNRITSRIPKSVMLAILDNAEEIRIRLSSEDWNEIQDPHEWKKSE